MKEGNTPCASNRFRIFATSAAARGNMETMGAGVCATDRPRDRKTVLTYLTLRLNRERKPGSPRNNSIALSAALANGSGTGVLPANIGLPVMIFSRQPVAHKIAPP